MSQRLPATDSGPKTEAVPDRRQFIAAAAGLIAAPMLMIPGDAHGVVRGGSIVSSSERFQPSTDVPTVTLNNGVQMPLLGFGTQLDP